MLGQTISDRYKLKKYIGGGMSSVYLAEDVILKRNVALKVINIPPHDREKSIKRFEREVQNTTMLSHPNIVKVLDVDEDDNHLYLVMEYVEGPTLSDYIKSHGPLSVEEAIFFTKQILRGIGTAHQHSIIHRDVKPQNILLTPDNEVRITDFGIARAMTETQMTQTNNVMGSVHYLSPEQAKGKHTDESSDIYSIGVVLFEMLTGHPPFEGDSAVSIAIKHIQDELPSIRAERSNVPQSIENIVLKATNKDKYRRYRSTEEMYEDVTSALDDTRKEEAPYTDVDDKTMKIPILKDEPPKVEEKAPIASEVLHKPKKKKNKFWWIFLPLLLLLLVGSSILYAMVQSKTVEVPDIQGKTVTQATSILEEARLRKGDVTYEKSETVKKGSIISTDPQAGKALKELSRVNVLVSSGQPSVKFGDYKGKRMLEVRNELDSEGYKKITVDEIYSDKDSGIILSHNVKAGTEVVPNETDLLFKVSKGQKLEFVKDYTGTYFDIAKSELEALGFSVTKVEQSDDNVQEHIILSQNPRNINYTVGSNIELTVSTGLSEADKKAKEEKEKKEEKAKEEKEEDASTEKSTTEGPNDNLMKSYTQSVYIPYTKDSGKSKVQIYIQDHNNKINKVFDSFEINSDTIKTFSMNVADGETIKYIVKVDGKIVEENEFDYDDF